MDRAHGSRRREERALAKGLGARARSPAASLPHTQAFFRNSSHRTPKNTVDGTAPAWKAAPKNPSGAVTSEARPERMPRCHQQTSVHQRTELPQPKADNCKFQESFRFCAFLTTGRGSRRTARERISLSMDCVHNIQIPGTPTEEGTGAGCPESSCRDGGHIARAS